MINEYLYLFFNKLFLKGNDHEKITLSAKEAEALVEQWENSRIFDILSP